MDSSTLTEQRPEPNSRLRNLVDNYHRWIQSHGATLNELDPRTTAAINRHIRNYWTTLDANVPIADASMADQIVLSVANTRSLLAQRMNKLQCDIQRYIVSLEQQQRHSGSLTELEKNQRQLQSEHDKLTLTHAALRSLERQLNRQVRQLLDQLIPNNMASHLESCRQKLHSSWTSHGLSRAIDNFFVDTTCQLADIDRHITPYNQQLEQIYQEYGQDEMTELVNDRLLNLAPHRQALSLLQRQANRFKGHYRTVFTQKDHVITIFSNTLLKEVQCLFEQIAIDMMAWPSHGLAPLTHYCNNQHRQLVKRLAQIRLEYEQCQLSHLELTQLRNQQHNIQLAIQALDQTVHNSPDKPERHCLAVAGENQVEDTESHLASQ